MITLSNTVSAFATPTKQSALSVAFRETPRGSNDQPPRNEIEKPGSPSIIDGNGSKQPMAQPIVTVEFQQKFWEQQIAGKKLMLEAIAGTEKFQREMTDHWSQTVQGLSEQEKSASPLDKARIGSDLRIAQEHLFYASKEHSSASERYQTMRPEMEAQITFFTKALAGLLAGQTAADAAANAAKP